MDKYSHLSAGVLARRIAQGLCWECGAPKAPRANRLCPECQRGHRPRRSRPPAGQKRCPSPAHEGPNPLPLAAFNRDRTRLDGLKSWCRDCRNRAARGRARRRAASPWPAVGEAARERAFRDAVCASPRGWPPG